MKKVLSVLLALVLVFALCVMPTSAETKSSEWKKGTGPGILNLTDDGAKISFDGGLQLFYYQKTLNVRDFTVKFKINTPDYSEVPTYVAMTIGGNGKYTGAGGAQAFIVMWLRGDHLCIDPQILHCGKADVKPASRLLQGVNLAEEDITIHCKQVDEYTYSLNFNDGALYYEFGIPENYNFVEDLNGEGCVAFGGAAGSEEVEAHEFGAVNLLVKEIDGVKMNGKDDPVSSNNGSTTGNSTDSGNTDTGINDGIITAEPDTDSTNVVNEENNNTLLIVVIIICGVLLLLLIASTVVIIILIKKKAPASEEGEVAEETTEE